MGWFAVGTLGSIPSVCVAEVVEAFVRMCIISHGSANQPKPVGPASGVEGIPKATEHGPGSARSEGDATSLLLRLCLDAVGNCPEDSLKPLANTVLLLLGLCPSATPSIATCPPSFARLSPALAQRMRSPSFFLHPAAGAAILATHAKPSQALPAWPSHIPPDWCSPRDEDTLLLHWQLESLSHGLDWAWRQRQLTQTHQAHQAHQAHQTQQPHTTKESAPAGGGAAASSLQRHRLQWFALYSTDQLANSLESLQSVDMTHDDVQALMGRSTLIAELIASSVLALVGRSTLIAELIASSVLACGWDTEIWGSDGVRTPSCQSQRQHTSLQLIGKVVMMATKVKFRLETQIQAMDAEAELSLSRVSNQFNSSPDDRTSKQDVVSIDDDFDLDRPTPAVAAKKLLSTGAGAVGTGGSSGFRSVTGTPATATTLASASSSAMALAFADATAAFSAAENCYNALQSMSCLAPPQELMEAFISLVGSSLSSQWFTLFLSWLHSEEEGAWSLLGAKLLPNNRLAFVILQLRHLCSALASQDGQERGEGGGPGRADQPVVTLFDDPDDPDSVPATPPE
eukprot:gene15049-21125_t